ncbi:hypothetical protein MAR_000152 [Mya arenaria]|uniref:CARD domain-containing protein n=1 Tax=Mya arenaria TaxID=6604 RepID=A0ABY7FAD3_MYAAR|nr:hypothetical protein MAR_000152 [Mya arenaria]
METGSKLNRIETVWVRRIEPNIDTTRWSSGGVVARRSSFTSRGSMEEIIRETVLDERRPAKVTNTVFFDNDVSKISLPSITSRLENIASRSTKAAVADLLDFLQTSRNLSFWIQFINALDQNGYSHLAKNLEGSSVIDATYQRQYLHTLKPLLRIMIKPSLLLDYLLRSGVINETQFDEISSTEKNEDRLSAADKLLNVLPNRHQYWFNHFVDALAHSDLREAKEILDIAELFGPDEGPKQDEYSHAILRPARTSKHLPKDALLGSDLTSGNYDSHDDICSEVNLSDLSFSPCVSFNSDSERDVSDASMNLRPNSTAGIHSDDSSHGCNTASSMGNYNVEESGRNSNTDMDVFVHDAEDVFIDTQETFPKRPYNSSSDSCDSGVIQSEKEHPSSLEYVSEVVAKQKLEHKQTSQEVLGFSGPYQWIEKEATPLIADLQSHFNMASGRYTLTSPINEVVDASSTRRGETLETIPKRSVSIPSGEALVNHHEYYLLEKSDTAKNDNTDEQAAPGYELSYPNNKENDPVSQGTNRRQTDGRIKYADVVINTHKETFGEDIAKKESDCSVGKFVCGNCTAEDLRDLFRTKHTGIEKELPVLEQALTFQELYAKSLSAKKAFVDKLKVNTKHIDALEEAICSDSAVAKDADESQGLYSAHQMAKTQNGRTDEEGYELDPTARDFKPICDVSNSAPTDKAFNQKFTAMALRRNGVLPPHDGDFNQPTELLDEIQLDQQNEEENEKLDIIYKDSAFYSYKTM